MTFHYNLIKGVCIFGIGASIISYGYKLYDSYKNRKNETIHTEGVCLKGYLVNRDNCTYFKYHFHGGYGKIYIADYDIEYNYPTNGDEMYYIILKNKLIDGSTLKSAEISNFIILDQEKFDYLNSAGKRKDFIDTTSGMISAIGQYSLLYQVFRN